MSGISAASSNPGHSQRILWVRVGGCLPLTSGGRIRSYFTLVNLLPRHRLHVMELHRHGEQAGDSQVNYAHVLQRVEFAGLPAWSPRHLPKFFLPLLRNYILSEEPFALERYRSAVLTQRLADLDQSGNYDLIVCDGLAAAAAFEPLQHRRRTPAVLFQHNVEAVIWERLAGVHTNPLARLYFRSHARRMLQREPQLCRLFDGIITISEEDASYHRSRYGLANVLGAVPAGADVDARGVPRAVSEPTASPVIAFLGSMDWLPNQDAVLWFIHQILPRIVASLPGARLMIIGRNPPPHLHHLAESHVGIELTGTVADTTEYLRRCSVMVVPLRAGSGTRIKILEAMATGVPVVSTAVGAEGLPLHSNQDLLLADDADGLASAVIRVLTDNRLRLELARNGLSRIANHFSWTHSAACFERLIAELQRTTAASTAEV